MMQEIDGMGWPLEVAILGINQIGHGSQNAAACVGKDIPWLQETVVNQCWTPWGVTYRDVVILDGDNERVATYNLTTHNLADPDDYAELKALLQAAAGGI